MNKLTILFTLLTLSAGAWANEITYTATSALTINSDNAFNLTPQSHAFAISTGKGTISFDGDVTEIRELAFANCGSLTSITIPETVTTIGDEAFANCDSLISITIPKSVTTIGEEAFNDCDKLTQVILPNTITTIGKETFANCDRLMSITIPKSVTTIESMAFYYCYFLNSITIPKSVTEIGDDAFAACGLTTVKFEGNACSNAIIKDAFRKVGTKEDPVTLILPEDWNYDAAPTDNATAWHGGYFNSNLFSTDGATDRKAAIDTITAILEGYSESAYLQSLLTEEVAKINAATNRLAVNERKQAAADRLKFAVTAYVNGLSDGQTTGDAAGYQRAKNELPTDAEDAKGAAVVITKGKKSVMLINPEKVEFIKTSTEE
ncbi:MAG: leucine-rich repeat domain-containing protein [Paludibacteraceae bacterium]|nr:leucine-rich repeat domain-containing protein [Paludibacteraceae bacterium]